MKKLLATYWIMCGREHLTTIYDFNDRAARRQFKFFCLNERKENRAYRDFGGQVIGYNLLKIVGVRGYEQD